jgi:tetratricopeptide (TPR) repeat protein
MSGAPLRSVAVAAAVALAACAGVARADTPPSVWDRARDPATADSYRIHLEVQRRLAQSQTAFDFGFSSTHESQKDTVRAMLERIHAEKSPDVRLRFDLGAVYVMLGRTEAGDYYKQAVEVLNGALALAPEHPAAEEAWMNLADACGHIGDHACERRAYHSVLRLRTDEDEHGTSTLNLAETEMHLGNLKEAVEGYREAFRIAGRYPSRTLAPLALWGLAVALDRAGDRAQSDANALRVLQMQQSSGLTGLLRSSGVFFYPDHEINWYDGVGAAALARAATTPVDQARYWKAAEDAFAAYVRGASRPGVGGTVTTDRWLELAKVRLAAAKTEREKAEKKRGKLPVQPQLDDEETPL